MIKKHKLIQSIITASLCLVSLFMFTASVSAQSSQLDSRFDIPAREVKPPEVGSIPQNSGFVDQNGNSVSREELQKAYDKSTGIQWQNIIMDVTIGLLIITAIIIVVVVIKKKKNKLNQITQQGVAPTNPNPVGQPPTENTQTQNQIGIAPTPTNQAPQAQSLPDNNPTTNTPQ
jgi:hypothetical protein